MDCNLLTSLEAERIRLRRISEGDVDALYLIFSDPQVMRYWSTPPLENRNSAVELLRELHQSFESRSFLKWGVALLANDLLIGTVTLFNLDLEQGRAEVGYALG